MVQVHNANFGTRVFFTTAPYNIFDTHANQAVGQSNLLNDVANNVDAFITDLRHHDISDNVTTLLYSEFGRRAHGQWLRHRPRYRRRGFRHR